MVIIVLIILRIRNETEALQEKIPVDVFFDTLMYAWISGRHWGYFCIDGLSYLFFMGDCSSSSHFRYLRRRNCRLKDMSLRRVIKA
jgi:hypothetical protein